MGDILIEDGERLDIVNDSLKLIQRKNGLLFGTDALMLAGYIRRDPRAIGVELGGGSGIVSLLALTRGKIAKAFVYEIQKPYADLCRKNAAINGLQDRLSVICGDIRLASESDLGINADVVYTNPPYMKKGAGKNCAFDERTAARREMNGDIYDFCAAAGRLLKFGGSFYAVFLPERLSSFFDAMRNNSLEPKRLTPVCHSRGKRPVLILCEAKKGGAEGLFWTKEFVIKDSGESADYRYLMENGDFDELYKKV